MESITAAQRHLGGRGAAGKERYLVWNTSLKTALETPGEEWFYSCTVQFS